MIRPIAALLGALTAVPLLYIGYFFWIASQLMGSSASAPGHVDEFNQLFARHIGTMLLTFALLAFYIPYLFRTSRVPQEKKTLWAVVLFMGNMIAMPVFWYHYVWKPSASQVRK